MSQVMFYIYTIMYVLWVMFMAYYIWWFFFLCLSAIMRSLKKKPMNPNLSILFVFSIFLCLFGSYAVGECRFKFVYFWWTDVYFKEISICISRNFSKSEDYSFFYFGNFHFVLVSVWSVNAQPCPTVCDPMDCSPPGSSVRGILQARTLEWVVTLFSRGPFWLRDQTQVPCIAGRLLAGWATRQRLLFLVSVLASYCCWDKGASQVAVVIKNPPANAGDLRDLGSIPGLGRCPGGDGNPFQFLAWRIPWMKEPGGFQSTGSRRVGHGCSDLARTLWQSAIHLVTKTNTDSFL